MENWPVSLQQKVNADSFTYAMGSTTVRSENDVGPAKVRSRFTDAVDVYQVSIYIDYDDIDTLQTFYKTLLNNGVDQFLFDDPISGVSSAFRFISPPEIRAIGGREFEVSMNWERMP
jgi:hypothetical protein